MKYFLAVLACLLPATAAAQTPCSSRDKVVTMLADKYKESRIGIGVAGPNGLLEIFASEEGTWTVILSQTTGKSCIMAAGQGWQETKTEPAKGEPL